MKSWRRFEFAITSPEATSRFKTLRQRLVKRGITEAQGISDLCIDGFEKQKEKLNAHVP